MNYETKKIIIAILNEIEKKDNIVSVRGGRGGGTGKAVIEDPHPVSRNLGHEENEEPEEYKLKPVKISKAFSEEEKTNDM